LQDDVMVLLPPPRALGEAIMQIIKTAVTLAGLILAAAAQAAPPSYAADPASSKLEFVGVQAGAEFKGTFHKFTSVVDFAPDDLTASRLDVQIDVNSVDTLDKDRDKTIHGSDVFDVAHFPTAHYVTKSIIKTASGYSAVGSLTLHGVTRDVPIDFQFVATTSGAKLEGGSKIKRLDFGVGQGDWKSTEWIADPVKVSFSLALKAKT
jgi:polyisoprenoid-binding protein YceI